MSDTLENARQLHRAGKLVEAERLYQQMLQGNGHDPEIWFLLGDALQGQGRLADAVESYSLALQYQPDHVPARAGLGVTLANMRKLPEAVAELRQVIRLRPDFAQAHHNLGVALAELGNLDEAIACLRQALALQPDYPEACYNLGNVLVSQKKREEAVTQFLRALELRPGYGEVYNNLGLALIDLRRSAEAAVFLEQGVRLRPVPEAHNNLGLALADLGRFEEAEASFKEALRLNPSYIDAHANLANLYKEQGRSEEALAGYQVALWLNPDAPSTHWNRALTWLQKGDFEKGWQEYEWRWKRKRTAARPFRQPTWDGSPLSGRTILLYMEQGLGDMLQFIRYAPLVKERGGRVVVECTRMLIPLFSTCKGIDQLVAEGEPLPDFDVQVPLMSLPRLFKTTLETVPAAVPYFFPDDELVERWRQRLTSIDGLKIGISWQGNPNHQWDRHRSFPLKELAGISQLPGVRLISLQKGAGTEQLKSVGFEVLQFGDELDTTSGAFMDSAAIIKNLDLVITVDSAIAHLAGALGAKVWLALALIVDWRWMFGGQDSPWYPTMRLFRQTRLGDWSSVFDRMVAEISKLRHSGGIGAVAVPVSPGELIDKLTILEIKSERMTDSAKVACVRAELGLLEKRFAESVNPEPAIFSLRAELKAVNEKLWEVEYEIRRCERAGDFGGRFISLARSVCQHNDSRWALKAKINQLLNSPIAEQKEYSSFSERSSLAAAAKA
jgi:tetratricopeptide (TPR) repeat protein